MQSLLDSLQAIDVDGVKVHSPASLIGAGPSTPADIKYISQSAEKPIGELKGMFASITI